VRSVAGRGFGLVHGNGRELWELGIVDGICSEEIIEEKILGGLWAGMIIHGGGATGDNQKLGSGDLETGGLWRSVVTGAWIITHEEVDGRRER
jgi:hypothetical protein